LLGPRPFTALHLIDRLGLFLTVFSCPRAEGLELCKDFNWEAAYTVLADMVMDAPRSPLTPDDKTIIRTLVRTDEELYHSWLLAAFVPWVFSHTRDGVEPAKGKVELIVEMARESIKAENKLSEILDGAMKNREDLLMKSDIVSKLPPSELEARPFNHQTRGDLGMAIRRWGRHWRLHTVFAILVEAAALPKGSEGKLSQNLFNQ
jgi:tRNA nucleotidyltransferase (CCA-adding enzyme)